VKPLGEWIRSLCILVDEIQYIGEDHRNCLELLHLGEHGLPIVPITPDWEIPLWHLGKPEFHGCKALTFLQSAL